MTAPIVPPDLILALFDRASDGLLLINPHGIIERANGAAAAITGIALADLTGQHIITALPQSGELHRLLQSDSPAPVSVTTLSGKRAVTVTILKAKTGARLILLRPVPLTPDSGAQRTALNHAITHDLRNPVAVLHGFADLLATSGPLTEEQDHYLKRIVMTASMIGELLHSVPDLAWLEADLPTSRGQVDLARLAAEALDDLDSIITSRKMRVRTEMPETPLRCIGDGGFLRAALFHIIRNALLYSPEGREVVIRLWQDDAKLWCSVSDHGYGIATEDLPHIFDRLYRSRDPRIRAIPGGGLGLTLARRALSIHGGGISVTSEIDVGSVFTLHVPVG